MKIFLQSVFTTVTNHAIIMIAIAVVTIATKCTSSTLAADKASTLDFICKQGSPAQSRLQARKLLPKTRLAPIHYI
jgi:hypothetical protein